MLYIVFNIRYLTLFSTVVGKQGYVFYLSIMFSPYRKTSNRSPRLLLEHFTFTPGLYWRPGFYSRPGFNLNIANLPF